jgi:biopolymer transport protein ExbD
MEENKTVEGVETQTDDNKTYTKEEIDKMIQSEADRRTALAQKEWMKKTQKQLAEAEKMAKLDEQQRAAYELETTKAELEQLKTDKLKAENTQATLRVLAKRELSADLLDFVLTSDADSTLEKIDAIQKIIKKAEINAVNKILPTQGTPKSGTSSKEPTSISGMKVAELNQLKQSNPELFNKLAGKN